MVVEIRCVRWASFSVDGVPGYGLVTATGVQPVPAVFAARYPDLRSALAAGVLEAAADAARANPRCPDPARVRLAPPVPNAGKILCVGVNFRAHMREMGREVPEHPVIFTRYPDSLVGSGCPIVRTRASEKFDYEGELACVIGRRARYVSKTEALSCVAGYTCFMDGSVRDFQMHTSQFLAGKNFPASGSCGPHLVTSDEVPDPAALLLQTRLNGTVMQSAPIADMCFGVADLVAYLSTCMQLEPGDVITTGTPSGVGFARRPPVWLQPGDVIEVDLGIVGVLRNTVVDEA